MTAPGKWLYDLLNVPIIDPDAGSWGYVYHGYVGFNAFEAAAWFAICLFVLQRFARKRRTRYEILYALSFFVFGLSDIMEIYRTTLGLLTVKGIILMSILACRKVVLGFYPQAKF
jgi:hypothetical protein